VSFPIHRAIYRTLDRDWEGEVFVADIDRTYLATNITSMRGMARIPFERAADKEDIAGMARLFREIRNGPGSERRETPLYFVSASPSQLRPVIERKMMLDGIGFDGTTFKNWTRVFRGMRLRRLREQLGFKLTALLTGRGELPPGAVETLVGDDLETDPLAFAIYADTLSGRIPPDDLGRLLVLNGVMPIDAKAIVAVRRTLAPNRGVRRVYIRMERYHDPEVFMEYGPGIVGCRGAFQMAAALMHEGCISEDGVMRVASDLLIRGLPSAQLHERLRDLAHRGLVPHEKLESLVQRLADTGHPSPQPELPPVDRRWEEMGRRSADHRWTPPRFLGEA